MKGSFKSFGPTPVKKLMPRHLLKPSKLFYGRAETKIMFIMLLNGNWGHRKEVNLLNKFETTTRQKGYTYPE